MPPYKHIFDRAMEKFEVGGDGCWPWLATRTKAGYGWIGNSASTKDRYAHRLMYEWLVGPIPEGLQLDHLCRVRHCVRPSHLEAVTPQVNQLRGNTVGARNAARTECPKGHSYTPENTTPKSGGRRGRECRACDNARSARNYQIRRTKKVVA